MIVDWIDYYLSVSFLLLRGINGDDKTITVHRGEINYPRISQFILPWDNRG